MTNLAGKVRHFTVLDGEGLYGFSFRIFHQETALQNGAPDFANGDIAIQKGFDIRTLGHIGLGVQRLAGNFQEDAAGRKICSQIVRVIHSHGGDGSVLQDSP